MDKKVLIIVIPALILILVGASFDDTMLATKFVDYLAYVGENTVDLSLFGGYSFEGGFDEVSKAFLYLLTIPYRLLWSIVQFIFNTVTYWGVAL